MSTNIENANALMTLLWGDVTPPKRGPKPTLTLQAIAQLGIAIADAEGLAAVTMQRVAEGLDVTKMALYRYVPGKAELVALMIDLGLGQPDKLRGKRRAWRSALVDWSRQLFVKFSEHPWALEATLGARIMGPNELGWLESALAALLGTGLEGGEMLDVVVTLLGHVRNLAQHVSALQSHQPEHALNQTLAAVLRGREAQFPALTRVLSDSSARGAQDQALEFGLNRILDGVEALLESRR
jgi:AcrR family transcriptional regulator